MNKVILVNVSKKVNQIQLPIGIGILINTLKKHNIEPELIDLVPIEPSQREEYFKSKVSKQPQIYGFSICIGNQQVQEAEKYARELVRINPNNIIVYGGALPSSATKLILENCHCNYVVKGEGEKSFIALVKALFNSNFNHNIKGVYYLKDEELIGEDSMPIKKLDQDSNIDYSLFDMDFYVNYLKQTGQSFAIMASRGCPFDCFFCYKVCGNEVSIRSPDDVLDNIHDIIKTYDIKRFYFVDENFFTMKEFFHKLVERKKARNIDFEFIVQARIDTIDAATLRLAKENGLVGISTGIESLAQDNLDKMYKGANISFIEEQVVLCKKIGIELWIDFIIGFEWDSIADYHQIIDFIKRYDLQKHCKLSYLTPLPGTKLWDAVIKKGLIKNPFDYIYNLDDLYYERTINLTSFPDEVLDYYYNKIAMLGRRLASYPTDEIYTKQMVEVH